MKRLRYCKRCKEVFEAYSKFGTISDKCRKGVGGHHNVSQKDNYTIDNILMTKKWRFGQYNKEKDKIKVTI